MRDISETMQARLESGATTLAHVWIIRRRDGLVQGFTDHDCDIAFNDVTCHATSGLDISELSERLGMSTTGGEVAGALSSEAISESDILAGLYDDAQVELHLVDWSDTAESIPLRAMVIGEITREDQAFRAELRSIAHRLDEEQGRRFTSTCPADLGDSRCGIDLDNAAFKGAGAVTALDAEGILTVSGLAGFEAEWFSGGRLTMLSGANAGVAVEVSRHLVEDGAVTLIPWQGFVQPVVAGDTFRITAGCDKSFAMCGSRFANMLNFRGFPFIPGNDYVVSYPVPGEPGYDGASLGVSS